MLYEITVPPFIAMLHNLEGILDKAQTYATTKKFDSAVLLNSRLAPDQFPMVKQVQIACDTAKLCAARLCGKDAPKHADDEQDLGALKARINDVMAYLKGFSRDDFAGAEPRRITQPRWEGKYLTGYEYALHHAIPNFYFHVSMAYAIIRHNGVDIGKKDYLGALPFKS